jgi:hypothetical protein
VQCIFCMKVVPAGIKRFKQHLSDRFGDAIKCPRVLELVSKEMYVYLKRNLKVLIDLDVEEGEKENRFASIREAGSKGEKSSPLVLEEFLWENEWVEESEEGDDVWVTVDEALGATQGLRGCNFARAAAAAGTAAPGKPKYEMGNRNM